MMVCLLCCGQKLRNELFGISLECFRRYISMGDFDNDLGIPSVNFRHGGSKKGIEREVITVF